MRRRTTVAAIPRIWTQVRTVISEAIAGGRPRSRGIFPLSLCRKTVGRASGNAPGLAVTGRQERAKISCVLPAHHLHRSIHVAASEARIRPHHGLVLCLADLVFPNKEPMTDGNLRLGTFVVVSAHLFRRTSQRKCACRNGNEFSGKRKPQAKGQRRAAEAGRVVRAE